MKTLTLACAFFAASGRAFATFCPPAQADQPCTPHPGTKTSRLKREVQDDIAAAQKMSAAVRLQEAAYLAAKSDLSLDTEHKLAACEAYRALKHEQAALYRRAMDASMSLYHVTPAQSTVRTAPPRYPSDSWLGGLHATWDPQVTDSGPDVKLAFRTHGSDGQDHYAGMTSMDPDRGKMTRALTLPDGRTFVLQGTFDLALRSGNPAGFLADILYHESRHFNRLSKGWKSLNEEEVFATQAELQMARVFQVSPTRIAVLKYLLADYRSAVAANQTPPLTPPPNVEAAWKDYYEHNQLNLEEEYNALKEKAAEERRQQEELQAREAEERRQREEAARTAEQEAATARAQAIADAISEIQQCGFQPRYMANGQDFSGFRTEVRGWRYDYNITHRMTIDEFRFGMMLAKACLDSTVGGIPPGQVMPCNAGMSIGTLNWSDPAFRDNVGFYYSAESEERCVRYLRDHWSNHMSMRSFARTLSGGQREYRRGVDDQRRREEQARQQAEDSNRQQRERQQPPSRPESTPSVDWRHPKAPTHCGFSPEGAYCY